MPTILDEFVIKLGLDSRGFQRDVASTQQSVQQAGTSAVRQSNQIEESLKKTQTETGKRFKQVEEVGKSVTQGFTKLRNEVGGLLATIVGAYGLEQFVKNIVTTNNALGTMSKASGIAVKDLAAFEGAAKRLGYEGGAEGIKSISDALHDFAWTKDSGMLATLKTLSAMKGETLELTDAAGKAADPIKFFLALADRFSKMTLPEALTAGRQMRLPDATTVLAHEGRDKFEKAMANQARLGLPTDADAKNSREVSNAFLDLQQAIASIGTVLVRDFGPEFTALLERFTAWVISIRDNPEKMKKFEDGIRSAITAVKEIALWFKSVVDYLGGWEKASIAVLALWTAVALAPVITAVTSLATWMGTLATATLAVDTAAAGGGIKWLFGIGALGGGAYGINSLLEMLEEKLYGKDFMDKDKAFRDQHSPIRDFVYDKLGWSHEGSRQEGVNAQEFHDKTYADLLTEAEKRHLPHPQVIASLGAAQASVESANGTSDLAQRSNNLFGIKPGTPGGVGESGRSGDYVAFSSREAAAAGYLDFITKNPRYAGAVNATSVGEAAHALAGAGYAEDQGYEKNIQGAYQRYGGVREAPRIPPVGPTFGPQLPPQSAIDPGWKFASRSPAALVNNSRSINSSAETNINGNIVIQTAAENAEDVSKDLARSLKRFMTPHQADYGLA